jgi:hypothetical protein
LHELFTQELHFIASSRELFLCVGKQRLRASQIRLKHSRSQSRIAV